MKKCRFPSLLAAVILLAALFLPMSAAAVEDPGLTCRNAILIDATYDEVLYDKGAYDKVYPASITKVMTALLVLEAVDAGQLTLDTPITATAEALEVPEGSSTAKIQVGDTYTLEQYLYCLLLPSGNEVAQILAIAVDGSVEAFVDHMNQRAEELGCEGTHFANPHGYHDDNHYTTAYDITRFMKAAMEYDLFQTILTSPNYTLPANGVSEERIIRNTNALTSNWTYTQYLYGPGTGGKTGTTDEAGCCLVETARKGDMYLISVILGAEEVKQADGSTDARQFSETIKLLNWGFDNFQRVTLSPDETLVTKVKVNLSTQADEVNVKPLGSITRTLPKDIDLEQVEMVLVMTVEPGFGGQGFIPECMDKIRAVRAEIQKHGYNCELEIDGGAKLNNTADIVAAGADVIVAGSAVFGGDIAANVKGFHEVFAEGVKKAAWSK